MKRFFSGLILFILSLVIIYPAAKPLFQPEFYQVHDYTHVARLAEMDLALKDGHFPVRWSKNFGYGYGMPLFNFYGPLPFYLGEVFHVFGFDFVTSIKLVVYFSFLGSFLGMFFLAKSYWGSLGALISATAVIYAPYRAVDLYVRGSINELYGITFTIIALACLVSWIRTKRPAWFVGGALAIFGLITSHNVTALMALPAILIFGLFEIFNLIELDKLSNSVKSRYSGKSRLLNHVFGFIALLALGLGLSASYTLPAFAEKSHTAVSNITTGYFDFHQHFLYLRQFINSPWGYGGSIFGLEDGLSFEIGKIHLLFAALTLMLFLPKYKTNPQLKWLILTSGLIAGCSMLMATFKTQFIWENLPLLAFIQFPWRFLSLIIIFVSLLSGGVINIFAHPKLNRIPIFLGCVIALILYNQPTFRPEKFLSSANDLYYSDPAKIQAVMSNILPDYMPPGVENSLTPAPARFQLLSGGETLPLTPTINRTHEFLVAVPLKSNSEFIANIFSFPGWRFYINDQEIVPQVSSPLPVYTFPLDPTFTSQDSVYISGYLDETPIRQIGNILSLLSAGIVVYISAKNRMSQIYG